MKGCIPPFPKKGDLGLAKNCRGITLTSIAAKIYNALLRNRIEPKIDNILRKNQNGFRRNRSPTSQILTICRILEGVRAKNLQATLLFVDFTKWPTGVDMPLNKTQTLPRPSILYTEGRWKNNYRRRLRWWHSVYWWIHPTKPKHYCLVWNEPPQALASMSMHTKLNTCVITKQVTFPHETEPFWN